MNKRTKQNRYKPKTASEDRPILSVPRSDMLFRLVPIILVVGVMSLGAVWLHDAVVQSPLFTIQTVEISGLSRISREDLLTRAGLNLTDQEPPTNLFDIQPARIEKRLSAHPWVAQAKVERRFFSSIFIHIEEQSPLAIVAIENLADIIINTQGLPFKEYDPNKDGLGTLPVITGIDLSLSDETYKFEGALFNSVMDLLMVKRLGQIKSIQVDDHTGILIQAPNIYNKTPDTNFKMSKRAKGFIPIKLGFNRFEEKLTMAGQVSRYMADRYPSKTILAMDLYTIEKIFIKTEDTLHNTIKKGA